MDEIREFAKAMQEAYLWLEKAELVLTSIDAERDFKDVAVQESLSHFHALYQEWRAIRRPLNEQINAAEAEYHQEELTYGDGPQY